MIAPDKVVYLHKAAVYQNKNLILNNVTMSMDHGEFVYLIGKTGSGKSSLLKTLYGELPLLTGTGRVAGFDLHSIAWQNIPMLRRQLGIVFQDFNLLMDRNVQQNLLFVLHATGWKDKLKMNLRIDDLLNRVGLSHKKLSMPHELSGGEQQRVVIARSLLNTPSVILADEPTGNLDPDTSDQVLKLLRELAYENNTAVLMATHDYYTLEKFPARIIRCQNGRIYSQENFELS